MDFGNILSGPGIVGVGRAMQRELDERDQRTREEEKFKREEDRNARQQYASFFEDIVKNPDKWPEGSDQAAAKMFLQIVGNPNVKLKDVQKMHGEFVQSTARTRAMDVLGLNKAKQVQTAGKEIGSTPSTFMPMQGVGQMTEQAGQQMESAIPTRELTGPLRNDELFEQEMGQYAQKYAAQREIEQRYAKPQVFQSNELGLIRVNPDGTHKVMVPGVPKRDTSLNAEEAFQQYLTMPDGPEKQALLRSRKEFFQSDDPYKFPPKHLTGGGVAPALDGDLVAFYAQNRSEGKMKVSDIPKEYRQAVDQHMLANKLTPGASWTQGAADKKAEFEGMLVSVQNAVNVFKQKGLGTGAGSNLLYTLRSYGVMGKNDPAVSQARADLSAAASDKLHQLSGAAISPMEMKRLERSIPTNFNMSDAEFEQQLTAFYRRLNNVYQRRYGPNGIGPSTGPNDTTDVDPDSGQAAPVAVGVQPQAQSQSQMPAAGLPSRKPAPPPGVRVIR